MILQKISYIIRNSFPIFLMIALIRLIQNDYILTLAYIIIIIVSLRIKREKKDILVFIVGFFSMIFFEYIFVRTGVEVFNRNSLLGMMPIWLPFLWGYGFIVIKRSVKIL